MRIPIILLAILVLATGVAQAPDAMGPFWDEGMATAPAAACDPLAPVEWDDPEPWCGDSPPWFEDPASVQCQSDACWEALENKTGQDLGA